MNLDLQVVCEAGGWVGKQTAKPLECLCLPLGQGSQLCAGGGGEYRPSWWLLGTKLGGGRESSHWA